MYAAISLIDFPLLPTIGFVAVAAASVLLLNFAIVRVTRRAIVSDRLRRWPSRIVYWLFQACVVVLAVSSFGSILSQGHMAEYALLAHVAFAGAFVFILVVVAAIYLPKGRRRETPPDHRWWFSRTCAWGLILSSLAAAATMFMSMLPILDTRGLLEFATLHRIAGLAVVVFAVFHSYASVITRLGWR